MVVVVVVVVVLFGLIIGPPLSLFFGFVFLVVEVGIGVVGSYSLAHVDWLGQLQVLVETSK